MVCLKRDGIIKRLLCFITAFCVGIPVFGVYSKAESASEPYWDYYSLMSFSSDHNDKLARGNWYNCDDLDNFESAELEGCDFSGQELRALKLTAPEAQASSLGSLMFVNVCNTALLDEASGMRFHVANPSDETVRIGLTYCDTNTVYSCHHDGAYYLETNGNLFKTAPTSVWSDFCEGGADDVGIIELSAGFSGCIYLPFSSTTRSSQKASFSRVRLFVGREAGKTQSLYLEGIDYYSSSVDFSGAKSADYGYDVFSVLPTTNAAPATDSEYISLGFSTEYRQGVAGKSLKAVFEPTTDGYGYTQWRINGLWGAVYDSDKYGMRFWSCNSADTDIEIRVQFGDGYKSCRMNAAYYLCDSGGAIRRYTTTKATGENIGCITLPAGFEGYVYLPYSLSTTGETAGHLILSPELTEQTAIYFDDFCAFEGSELESVVWHRLDTDILLNSDTALSYSKTLLDTGLSAAGQWISLSNPNSFDVRLDISSPDAGSYYLVSGGITERCVALSGAAVIPGGFEGSIYIPFSSSQTSLYTAKVSASEQSGTLSIGDIGVYSKTLELSGDVNSDTYFNIIDLIRMKKYFAGESVTVSHLADIDKDESVNSFDLTLLRKGLILGVQKAFLITSEDAVLENAALTVKASAYSDLPLMIADINAADFGADPTGTADSTTALKKAVLAAEQLGGGTVYIPEGVYLVSDTVTVPESVTLWGEWQSPKEGSPALCGTVIEAIGDNFLQGAVFELSRSTGLIGLNIIYPEQSVNAPKEYDFTVRVTGNRCYTLENVTVMGAWNGIELGSASSSCQLYYLKNVYISALNTAVSNDRTSDIGRMDNVSCSPEYWCDNALYPMTDAEKASVKEYFFNNSYGFRFYLNDWSIAENISASGLKTGLYFGISESGKGSNGKFCGVDINNCDTGIYIDETKIGGVDFTNLTASADTACTSAIDTGTAYAGTCMFYNTDISGSFKYPVRNNGMSQVSVSGTLHFVSGSIGGYDYSGSYAVTVNGGSVTMEDIYFDSPARHLATAEKIQSVSMLGCTFEGSFDSLIPEAASDDCDIDHTPVSFEAPSEILQTQSFIKPQSDTVVCVTDYGASTLLSDNTAAFTRALEALRGIGGTVYVPAGNWRFEGELSIPSGVELRGSNAVQFMQNPEHRSGTVLWPFSGKGNAEGAPFISLEENSSVRGFAVFYAEQNSGGETVAYPYSIRALGKGCGAVNVTITNSYNGIDFASYDTSGYYIDSVNGAPVSIGISVGGNAQSGTLKNCHFNPNFSYILTGNTASIDYRLYNATAFEIGDMAFGYVYGLFAYGYKNGIHIKGNADALLLNCGIDGSETSVRITDAQSVDIVNGQFVAMASENEKHCLITENSFEGSVRVYNSNLWGPTDHILNLGSGNAQFHLVNLCTGYGEYALYMTGGSALFNAVSFHNPNISVSGSGTAAEFFGCFTRSYQAVIAPEAQNGAVVTVNNSHWA